MLLRVGVLFAALLVVSPLSGQVTLDQSFTGPHVDTYWLMNHGAAAQVYTAGITGDLASVKISLFSMAPSPAVVQILDPANSWALLGYTMITVPGEGVTCSTICDLIPASFSPPVPQTAGKQYAIAIFPTYPGQMWFGSNAANGTYSGGGVYVHGWNWADITPMLPSLVYWEQVSSFYFQTYVKPSHKK
jgi:hypothetical protein